MYVWIFYLLLVNIIGLFCLIYLVRIICLGIKYINILINELFRVSKYLFFNNCKVIKDKFVLYIYVYYL